MVNMLCTAPGCFCKAKSVHTDCKNTFPRIAQTKDTAYNTLGTIFKKVQIRGVLHNLHVTTRGFIQEEFSVRVLYKAPPVTKILVTPSLGACLMTFEVHMYHNRSLEWK